MVTLEDIKSRILKFNDKTDDTSIKEDEPVIIEQPLKTGSDYAIDQFNMRQRYLEYQAAVSKNKKAIKAEHEIRIFESAGNFMDAFEKKRYLKKWNRVDDFAKKNRINEYFRRWLEKHNEITSTTEELTKNLMKELSNKTTAPKINYDDINGVILNIEKWTI
jgi:hypothetical protein